MGSLMMASAPGELWPQTAVLAGSQVGSHTVPQRNSPSHRGGQGFKSPQLHAKLQVAALFRGYFWLPILAPFLSWERMGADLVQPTSLTSGDVRLLVRRVGAVAS
jgi:hypothetical protein